MRKDDDRLSEKLDRSAEKLDESAEKLDASSEKLDESSEKLDESSEKLDESSEKLDESSDKLPSSVTRNIETISGHYARHEEQVTRAQAFIEKLSLILGSPGYVAGNVFFIVGWIFWNLFAPDLFDVEQFDEPPFFWLQGIIGLNALLISTTVLIRQNRMSVLAAHNAHLDLQISLLAEEKASKIIAMLEELRRDIPNIPNKHDPQAEELAQSADTNTVLDAIEREEEFDDSHDKS